MSADIRYLMLAGELHYEPYLRACLQLAACRRWVDLGAGSGRVARRVSQSLRLECTAVDTFAPTQTSSLGWSFVVEDVEHYLSRCTPDPHAVMSLLDVIEHFEREKGEQLLDEVCRLSGAQVVFTPWGFYPQDAATSPELADCPPMWHRSGWGLQDFLDRGFLVLSLPMYHHRRGALFAFRRSDWSEQERAAALLTLRQVYFRRLWSPSQALRRTRSAIFYWFGRSAVYAFGRGLIHQVKGKAWPLDLAKTN